MSFGKTRGMELKQVWKQMEVEKKIDVLITHSPPFGILDESSDFMIELEQASKNSPPPSNSSPCPPTHPNSSSPPTPSNSSLPIQKNSEKIVPVKHYGDEELLIAVKKKKPLVHLFGHIHRGYGTFQTKNTLFVNCASKSSNHLPMNPPIVIRLQK